MMIEKRYVPVCLSRASTCTKCVWMCVRDKALQSAGGLQMDILISRANVTSENIGDGNLMIAQKVLVSPLRVMRFPLYVTEMNVNYKHTPKQ